MKHLKKLGKALSKKEQRSINGSGNPPNCCARHLCWTVDCADGDPCILACAPFLNEPGTMLNGSCCI
ncbi:MAG: hypothetical protein AAFX55_14695 [Bacteroidota bacterium]